MIGSHFNEHLPKLRQLQMEAQNSIYLVAVFAKLDRICFWYNKVLVAQNYFK